MLEYLNIIAKNLWLWCDPVDEAKDRHGQEDPKRHQELPGCSAAPPAWKGPTPDGGEHLLADRVGYKLKYKQWLAKSINSNAFFPLFWGVKAWGLTCFWLQLTASLKRARFGMPSSNACWSSSSSLSSSWSPRLFRMVVTSLWFRHIPSSSTTKSWHTCSRARYCGWMKQRRKWLRKICQRL